MYVALRVARSMTLQWLHELGSRLHSTVDDHEVQELRIRLCEISMTCRATFDVDPQRDFLHILSSPEDISAILICSVELNMHLTYGFDQSSPEFGRMLRLDHRLAHSLEPFITRLIRNDSRGLDMTLKSIWSASLPYLSE